MRIKTILLVIFIVLLTSNDISAVIWSCTNNMDCKALSINATCSNGGNCMCPPGQVYSTSSITCVDAMLIGEKCQENVQCSLMPTGAGCIEGVCQCKKDYTYIHGQCRKLSRLGENCSKDVDCWYGYNRMSVVCSTNETCVCSQGYYKRHSEICRKISSESEPCVVHTDCPQRNCVNFVCMAKGAIGQTPKVLKNQEQLIYDKYQSDAVFKKFGDNCTTNGGQCDGLAYSICVENACYCKLGYYPHPITKICYAELGESASLDTCVNELAEGLCTCRRDMYYDNSLRTCRKSIVFTAPCTADNQCSPYAAYCKLDKPRKCTCPLYSEYDEVQQLCIKKQGIGAPCEKNENCPIENSMCSKDKMCICKDKYFTVNGTCLAGIGANCTDNKQCRIEHAICSMGEIGGKKTCNCQPDFIHSSNRCLKKSFNIGDDCVDNKQCESMLANCVQNKCICADNEHYSYGKCELRKYIGQSCSRAGECFIPSNQKSVECRNSICMCKYTYQTDFDGTNCIESKSNSSNQLQGMVNILNFSVIISAITVFKLALI